MLISDTREIGAIFNRYIVFCKETEKRTHGKTSQFWMQYINLIHVIPRFYMNYKNWSCTFRAFQMLPILSLH